MNTRKRSFLGKTKLLSELCDSITDCHHSTPEWTESGKLVIRNFNIKKGKLKLNDLSFTSEETYKERIKRKKPEPGDLIITREAPMGEVCMIPEGLECCLGQRMVLLKPNKKNIKGKYLLYALQSEFVQIQILKSDNTGSIVSNLRIPVLEQLNIPVFDVISENKIGSLLSDIDAKIELNNLINNELELIAKTIYDYWFLQFDFPDENGKPYKSSGGKMVWNEELKREIPEGWEVAKMEECAEIKKGDLITSKDAEIGSIKVVAAGIDFSYFHSTPNRMKNTITISGSGANAGYINFWREPIFASDCITVRGKSDTETLILLQYLKFIQSHILNQATGSAQPHVYPSDIKALNYIITSEILIRQYGELMIPTNDKIAENLNENIILIKLRDWLLPMLMNGQVKVN